MLKCSMIYAMDSQQLSNWIEREMLPALAEKVIKPSISILWNKYKHDVKFMAEKAVLFKHVKS